MLCASIILASVFRLAKLGLEGKALYSMRLHEKYRGLPHSFIERYRLNEHTTSEIFLPVRYSTPSFPVEPTRPLSAVHDTMCMRKECQHPPTCYITPCPTPATSFSRGFCSGHLFPPRYRHLSGGIARWWRLESGG